MTKQVYERDSYNTAILTPKKSELTNSWPKFKDGRARFSSMGETGERAVAHSVFLLLNSSHNNPIDLEIPLSYFMNSIPITTNQMLERGMITESLEKTIQENGIDVVILPRAFVIERKKLDFNYFKNNLDKCIQVKLQPWAPNYGSITVETGLDRHYYEDKWYDRGRTKLEPAGINKTASKWTAYIISGGTIFFMKTQELKKAVYDGNLRYIGNGWKAKGTTWGTYEHKRNVGTTTTLYSLLNTGTAQPVDVSPVFRDYFTQIHDPLVYDDTEEGNSWKLFVQDWSVETMKSFVGGGLAALDDKQIRGNKNVY